MLALTESVQVFVALEVIDFRKSLDGLAMLIAGHMQSQPQSGHVYVFRNRSFDRVKCLYWDKNGFVLHYKRLEKGRFRFPKMAGDSVLKVSHDQLSWLLAGLDFCLMNQFSELNYAHYF